ncbi:hypothetical protein [Myroides fluvii]|uniref:hypothetical protein n=1 Tax=Myroides fluvii TaxID=2572594 RepID=UPI001E4EC22B|nr:hypothetical protein [Myroides fluvii]
MFSEKMNIYKQNTAKFIVAFVCVMLIFLGVVTGDYVFSVPLAILVLAIHFYTRSLDFTIGHTAESLVFGWRKKHVVSFDDIKEISVENLDYMGKFGGYGYRKFRNQSAYIFNDSGNFLCVKTADRNYFFSIDDKAYWSNWSRNRENLSSVAQSFTKLSC